MPVQSRPADTPVPAQPGQTVAAPYGNRKGLAHCFDFRSRKGRAGLQAIDLGLEQFVGHRHLADILTGGGDADTFIYADGGADVITDFDNGLDLLKIDKSVWGGTELSTEQVLAFASVISGDTVFDFGNGNTLTLENVTDLSGLTRDLALL